MSDAKRVSSRGFRRGLRGVMGAVLAAAFAGCGGAPEGAAVGATQSPAAEGPAPGVTAGSVERGRMLVVTHACGDCHGGFANPAADGWMAGMRDVAQQFAIGPFITRPRNLTPDNETGIGRFTERQIFNALRYGLRPGETPDVEITSNVAGQGNFPAAPKYLAPPMPWPAFRYLPDQDLWDMAAYLKNGVRPVVNRVQDSDGPPDFWASEYTPEKIGTYPITPFPTANEIAR